MVRFLKAYLLARRLYKLLKNEPKNRQLKRKARYAQIELGAAAKELGWLKRSQK